MENGDREMAVIGYARVSTTDQNLDGQMDALKAAGAVKIFSEKESGTKTDRKALANAIASLNDGDVLVVTRIDRLARSTLDLLQTLEAVSKRGAGFKALNDPWADTTTAHGKLMLTVLAGIGEFERSLILARTTEGRVRAKAKGIRFGRKPKLTDYQQAEVMDRLAKGHSHTEVARSFNVHQTTISALAKRRATAPTLAL
jgi:DNA invertase Pin-like site-specific DNA recombinase